MDPERLFRTELFLLKLNGFKLDYKNNWKDSLMILLAIFSFFSLIFQFSFFFYNCTVGRPTVEVFSESFSCVIATVESILKLTLFYVWSGKLKEILRIMTKILNSGKSLSEENFNKISKDGRNLLKFFFISATLTSSMFVLVALYKNLFEWSKVLPFKGTFFIDPFKSPRFEIFFFLLTYATFIVSRVCVVFDILFFRIGSFVCEHLKVIQANLSKADPGNFKGAVQQHQEILKFCQKFNEFYGLIIAEKFFCFGMAVCILGFQIMTVSWSILNKIKVFMTF